jgi:hypothetical protein
MIRCHHLQHIDSGRAGWPPQSFLCCMPARLHACLLLGDNCFSRGGSSKPVWVYDRAICCSECAVGFRLCHRMSGGAGAALSLRCVWRRSGGGVTPLMRSACHGHAEMAEWLVGTQILYIHTTRQPPPQSAWHARGCAGMPHCHIIESPCLGKCMHSDAIPAYVLWRDGCGGRSWGCQRRHDET